MTISYAPFQGKGTVVGQLDLALLTDGLRA